MIPPGLLKLFNQSLTLYRSVGQNSRGDRLYSTTGEIYKCRQENSQNLVKDRLGQDIITAKRTFVAAPSTGSPGINVDDKVVMPDGSVPKLVAVDTLSDAVGVNHQVLYS